MKKWGFPVLALLLLLPINANAENSKIDFLIRGEILTDPDFDSADSRIGGFFGYYPFDQVFAITAKFDHAEEVSSAYLGSTFEFKNLRLGGGLGLREDKLAWNVNGRFKGCTWKEYYKYELEASGETRGGSPEPYYEGSAFFITPYGFIFGGVIQRLVGAGPAIGYDSDDLKGKALAFILFNQDLYGMRDDPFIGFRIEFGN